MQLRTSAHTGQPDEAVGADAAVRAFAAQPSKDVARKAESDSDPSLAHELVWLFEADAAQRFAGAATSGNLPTEERARVLALLARIR